MWICNNCGGKNSGNDFVCCKCGQARPPEKENDNIAEKSVKKDRKPFAIPILLTIILVGATGVAWLLSKGILVFNNPGSLTVDQVYQNEEVVEENKKLNTAGHFDDEWVAVGYDWFVHPFVFDSKVENCRSLTIKTTIGVITEGSPYGKWNIYARVPAGTWVLIGHYNIAEKVQSFSFSFDKPLSFTAVATQLQQYGPFSFDFSYEVSEIIGDASSNQDIFNGHRYEVVNENMEWQQAVEYAESRGGYLATITSEEEEMFIEHLICDEPMYQYWLGGYRIAGNESEFCWITGEPFTYTNWESWEPNNYTGKENCIQICKLYNSKDGESGRMAWNDIANDNLIPGEEDFFSMPHVGLIVEYDDL